MADQPRYFTFVRGETEIAQSNDPRYFTFVRGEVEIAIQPEARWFTAILGEVEIALPPWACWIISATDIACPYHDGGYKRETEPIGGIFEMADGSVVPHLQGTRLRYDVIWRVSGDAYTDLIAATNAIAYVPGSVRDHLGNTETMMLVDRTKQLLEDNATREVRVTFREAV